jgi:citrate lyase subunit beta/citryl-CoA lyase
MLSRPRRSALYLPASNEKAIAKARSLPSDVVILDLEDTVAPEAKKLAREQAITAVQEGGFGKRELVVRVNGLDTPWGKDDLAAIAAIAPGAVLVPKVMP